MLLPTAALAGALRAAHVILLGGGTELNRGADGACLVPHFACLLVVMLSIRLPASA